MVGAGAQGLAVGLTGSPDVGLGDRRERDELDGVDLDPTFVYRIEIHAVSPER